MENFIKVEVERLSKQKIDSVVCKKNYIFNIYFENGNFGILNFIDRTVNDVFIYESEEEFVKGSKELNIIRNINNINNQKDFISFTDRIIRKDTILAFKTNIVNQNDKNLYEISNVIWLKNDNECFSFSTNIYYELDKDIVIFDLNNEKIVENLKNNLEYKNFIKNVNDLMKLKQDYNFIKFGSTYINKDEITNIELNYKEKEFFNNSISFGIRIFLKNGECFIDLNTLSLSNIKVNENYKSGEVSIIELLIFFYKKIFKTYSFYELEELLKLKEPEEYKKYIELKNYLQNLS